MSSHTLNIIRSQSHPLGELNAQTARFQISHSITGDHLGRSRGVVCCVRPIINVPTGVGRPGKMTTEGGVGIKGTQTAPGNRHPAANGMLVGEEIG